MNANSQTMGGEMNGGALAPGRKVGPYEVVAQIGSGGMGIVWRAHDRLLGRDVAIKQIAAAEAADELTRRRFRQEGELQKELSQRCDRLVELIEVINEGRGLFIVMEYVQGLSLEQALAQHRDPVDPAKALAVVRDVARALAAIHAEGVVHRDLKPGNILLSANGAKVGDFGIASLVAQQQEALPMGTAAYMAPELFGDGPIDGRADIYALGLIAYEMFVGRANYEQAFKAVLRDKRNRAVRWMKWHTNARAKVAPVSQYAPAVPPLLTDLIDRMMAKELPRRIQSAQQLLETIERHFVRPDGPAAMNGAAGATANGATRPAEPTPTPPPPPSPPTAPPAASVASASGPPQAQPTPMPVGAAAGGAAARPGNAGEDATAPLPARSRKVVWLAGAVVAGTLVLGGVWAFDQHRRGQAEAAALAAADERFEAAMTAFDEGQYEAAEQQWNELAAAWDDHVRFGVGAEAYAQLATAMHQAEQADTALGESEYDVALEAYNAATDAVNEADDIVHSHEAARVAASRLIRRIQTAQSDLPNRAAFARQAKVIADAAAEGDFDAARQHHRDLRQTLTATAGALTGDEREKLDEIGTMIEDQAARHEILQVDREAQRLIEQGDLERAEEILAEAEQEFEDRRLSDRLSDVSEQLAFTTAKAEAASARRRGDLHEAVAALDRAYRIEPSGELKDELARTQSDAALADGREAEAAGDLERATRHLVEAVSHWENEEAQELLTRVRGVEQVETLLEAAEAAEASEDYSQAVNLYRRAVRLLDDGRTQTKLNAALVRMHTSDAQAALERGDVETGREALAAAAEVNREDDEVQRLQERLTDYEAIAALRKEAEAAREVSRFGEAKAAYRRAVERAKEAEIDAAEMEERLEQIEFDHLIAQARGAIQAERWSTARAYLQVALRMRHSDEVEQMLREVEAEEGDDDAD